MGGNAAISQNWVVIDKRNECVGYNRARAKYGKNV